MHRPGDDVDRQTGEKTQAEDFLLLDWKEVESGAQAGGLHPRTLVRKKRGRWVAGTSLALGTAPLREAAIGDAQKPGTESAAPVALLGQEPEGTDEGFSCQIFGEDCIARAGDQEVEDPVMKPVEEFGERLAFIALAAEEEFGLGLQRLGG